jgi:hypothetical protein
MNEVPDMARGLRLAADCLDRCEHYRQVLNRICRATGHVPLAPTEGGVDSVAVSVEAICQYKDLLQEELAELTPDAISAYAASQEHHEEHHRLEAALMQELDAARRVIHHAAEALKYLKVESYPTAIREALMRVKTYAEAGPVAMEK